MAEKFGVDSAFGYRAAVYGDVLGVLACAVLMYYLRKKLLARAALACCTSAEMSTKLIDGRVIRRFYFSGMFRELPPIHAVSAPREL